MRAWRTLCRISRVDEKTVNIVVPAAIVYWFSVRRTDWPDEIPLKVGRYFHAQVNIGAEHRRDMSMSGPYELEEEE